ncbi:MAG: hypothetical protein KatS3mg034_0707 [Vicingaceae bacterium]|nr:MAG: hypothetical protein KatS3mg034_0707 [Vicingaceae bacterium]
MGAVIQRLSCARIRPIALRLTIAGMKRWGLQASFLSTETNADAGQSD